MYLITDLLDDRLPFVDASKDTRVRDVIILTRNLSRVIARVSLIAAATILRSRFNLSRRFAIYTQFMLQPLGARCLSGALKQSQVHLTYGMSGIPRASSSHCWFFRLRLRRRFGSTSWSRIGKESAGPYSRIFASLK